MDMLPKRETTRIDALDGLRGIAILAVVFQHVCVFPELNRGLVILNSVFSLGHFGSEFFLVLSGYFMTKSLQRVNRREQTIGSVIVRRYLRIAPLYYLACFIYVLLFPPIISIVVSNTRPIPGAGTIILYLLDMSNISIALHGYQNYFDVTWTLNVQDQFYLFWIPFVMISPMHWRKWLCVTIILSVQIARVIAADYYLHETLHVLTPFRMDAIAIGCYIAILNAEGRIHPHRLIIPVTILSSVAFLILLAIFPCLGAKWFTQFGYSLIGMLSVLWLWTGLTTKPTHVVGRILCSRCLCWYGQRSYAIFLFHFLVYYSLLGAAWFVRHKIFHLQSNISHTYILSYVMGLLTIPACIPVAWVLWKVVEEPVNRIRDRVKTRSLSSSAAASAV